MKFKSGYLRLAAAVLTVCCAVSVCAYGFFDVDTNTSQGAAVMKMWEAGYIQGYEDGTFRPNSTITRAELVTIVNDMYGYTLAAETGFFDVHTEDWYCNAVLCAVQAGYISGYDDKSFRPNAAVTREEVCVMMNRILNAELLPYGKEITDTVSDWARDSVEKLVSNRLFTLEEGGRFRGTEPITRGETCLALEKCIVEDMPQIEPIDLSLMARDELEKHLENIINDMEAKVIPKLTYEVNNEIAARIIKSMEEYIKTPDYDYVSDAQATYEIYRKSGKAARELKDLIYQSIDIDELSILFDFFYTPDIDAVD